MASRADGNGDYAIRTAGGFYDPTACTIALYALLESDINASGAVFGIRDTTAPAGDGYIYYYNPTGDGVTYGWEHYDGVTERPLDMAALTLNTWYFIAISRAGTGANQTTAYRRTASATSFTSATGTYAAGATINEEIVLSNGFAPSASYFPGRIAALKQWSAALSADELWNESMSFLPVRTANLHSWRPKGDNTVAGNMIDYSGNGRNLTANGSLLVADGPPIAWRQGARRIFIPAAGGTTFNITPSGASTPTGTLAKQVNKTLSGASTPVGALSKLVNKVFSGASTPIGVLSTIKVVLRSFSGSSTPIGTLAKQVNKSFTGSSTPVGTLSKLISKFFSGFSTPIGSLLRQIIGGGTDEISITIRVAPVTRAILTAAAVTRATLSAEPATSITLNVERG